MTQETFLEELQGILRTDVPLSIDYPLDELDEWDSMAMLAIVTFAEKEFQVSLDVNDFRQFETPGDIYRRLTGNGDRVS